MNMRMPKPPRQRMFDAVRTGNVDGLRRALASGANIRDRDDDGRTALHVATFMNHRSMAIFNTVLAAKPDLDIKDNRGHTALHLAAGSGLTDKGMALIEAGASIDAVTPTGATPHDYAFAASCEPLMRAIEARQAEDLRQQLERNTAQLPDLNDPAVMRQVAREQARQPKRRGMRL